MDHHTSTDHVRGLDAIRFVCALWVFLGHGAAPTLPSSLSTSFFGLILRGFYGNLWNGPAAVIVFFVISGFCIHYPFAGTRAQPQVIPFYTRRFLRLLVPVLVATPFAYMHGIQLTLFHDSILWSLLAELIYYVSYPVLRAVQLALGGWNLLCLTAYGVALAVTLSDPTAKNYPSYGPMLNWALGLPCWLLGCGLAEVVRQRASSGAVSVARLWGWGVSVLAAAWFCSVLRFHSPVGYPWTLNLFAGLATLWLVREIQYHQQFAPSRILEWAGRWSYSLYLLHLPADAFVSRVAFSGSPAVHWLIRYGGVLFCCYVFYRLIEYPSHLLARRVAKWFEPVKPPTGLLGEGWSKTPNGEGNRAR